MLTRSELTEVQAEDLLEKIQSDVFAGINCGWVEGKGGHDGGGL